MRPEEARQEIIRRAVVTRQLVSLAKAFLLSRDGSDMCPPLSLIDEFAKQQGFERIPSVVLNPGVDPEPQLTGAAKYLACQVVLVQALWELIGLGYYMPDGQCSSKEPSQGWETVTPGRGGASGGWRFPELRHVVPSYVVRSPYWRLNKPEPITDPDLFQLEAGIDGADSEVVEALQDAVRCIRYELYRPAATLLGKAMEGAWVELGIALANALPDNASGQRGKTLERMRDQNRGIARKVEDVVRLYEQRDLMGVVITASGVSPQELKSAVLWSDVVREARNAIHFGVKPAIANTYEKVVVLLLDAAKSLGMMYRIKRTAERQR